MKKLATKDILFVTTQLLLFVLYFIPFSSMHFEANGITHPLGIALTMVGLLFILFAIIQLNKNLTPFPTPKEQGTLIKTGLYKSVRHPIYSGIILASIGYGLYNYSFWEIGIGFILWILFYFKSRYEESLLVLQYPDYEEYRKNTPRFFLFK